MIRSLEARDMMKMFTLFQRLEILSREEEFDMYYVWLQKVEEYVEKYN